MKVKCLVVKGASMLEVVGAFKECHRVHVLVVLKYLFKRIVETDVSDINDSVGSVSDVEGIVAEVLDVIVAVVSLLEAVGLTVCLKVDYNPKLCRSMC